MSLVLCSNKDADKTQRQEQSIYNAWSFTNALSSTYEIPENSQVCLQSAKVNLDGRSSITQNNSQYYTWFGKELSFDEGGTPKVFETTSYPILQNFNTQREVLELTTDEIAERVNDTFKEYHPNKKGQFDCSVDRNSGLDFLGYNFNFQQTTTAPENSSSLTFSRFYDDNVPQRFLWTSSTGIFQRNDYPQDEYDPAVGIGLGTPISLANGSLTVIFDEANASGCEWGVGLSRDCPNTNITSGEFIPPYFNPETFDEDNDESLIMGLGNQMYFADFSVHRNEADELVVRHAVNVDDEQGLIMREVEYWNNPDSDFSGGRYDLAKNTAGYEWVNFIPNGEDIELYIGHGGSTDLVCKFSAAAPKSSYFKPIAQTCWCLHPVLFVGTNEDGTVKTQSLEVDEYHGVPIADYDSRVVHKGGWFEAMSLLDRNRMRALETCKSVDMRLIFDYTTAGLNTIYTPASANNASSGVNLSTAMILAPNSTYVPSYNAATANIFGFPGRSLVITPSTGSQNSNSLTFTSDEAPDLRSLQSIFVRLKNFGNQVLNARTGNRSTILAHLPTADSAANDGSLRIFYEPNNKTWLDLDNSYPLKISSFDLDFVYSNEQYARILQGQSIVMLQFRKKPTTEE
jgi:hypothetical protein